MGQIRIGVLRGGPSSEYDVSLDTGKNILFHMPERFEANDIFIDRSGQWHMDGMPRRPADIADRIDVFVLGLHGHFGEDGQVQKILNTLGRPYTGSEVAQSVRAMNKHMTKEHLKDAGISMPRWVFVGGEDEVEDGVRSAFAMSAPPYVVKPVNEGSSVGVTIVKTIPELEAVLGDMLTRYPQVLIEEWIQGREVTCGVLNYFRDEDIYTFPPVEIIAPHGKPFFDYDAKYGGDSIEECPGRFTREESRAIADVARKVHELLGLRHYSRSDFILTRHGPYFLEVNTLPGLTEGSLYPKGLEAVGSSMGEFLEHIITLALRGK